MEKKMENDLKSFDEYFAGYKNYDNGGKLDQVIIADAKKVFETLRTPEAIEGFYKADYKKQQEMVPGLDDGHSGFSFGCVCQSAFRYATYAQKYVKSDPKEKLSSMRQKLAEKEDGKSDTKDDVKVETSKSVKQQATYTSKGYDYSD